MSAVDAVGPVLNPLMAAGEETAKSLGATVTASSESAVHAASGCGCLPACISCDGGYFASTLISRT